MGGGRMKFRPCIDIHNGSVKQIVGASLADKGDFALDNFVSEYDGAYYAIYDGEDICTYLSNENYCRKLLSRNYLDVRKIIITNYSISDEFIKKSAFFDRTMREYIKVMTRYTNTSSESIPYEYERRLIVSFNDGRVGNIELLFDGGE